MKKKRLIILLSILVVVAVIGCFTFLYRAAAAEKDTFYKKYITSNEVVERLNRLPELIELESDSKPGYTIHFQDYSLTLPGYDNVIIDKDLNDDFILSYHIGDDMIVSFEDMSKFKSNDLFNFPALSYRINKAAGRAISNEYDFWEFSFYCTPDDFTLLDKDKNRGVSMLLERKHGDMFDNCYQFDNGTIKGFVRIMTSGGTLESVIFSNCEVPDSFYQIRLCNFSIEEVKEMLGTITFDGSNTKQ